MANEELSVLEVENNTDDADDILNRSLPDALDTLISLQDDKTPLTDELTMQAWEMMQRCAEETRKQVIRMCDQFDVLPGRRGLISALHSTRSSLDDALTARLSSSAYKPRLYRLAEAVGFSEKEVRAFVYILVHSDSGRDNELKNPRRQCRKFAGMSRTEMFSFFSPNRKHIKQGLVTYVDEYTGMVVHGPVIKALYGGDLTFDEGMSLSSSAMAATLAAEKGTVFSIVNGVVMIGGIPMDKKDADKLKESNTDSKASANEFVEHPEKISALIGSLEEGPPGASEHPAASEVNTLDDACAQDGGKADEILPYESDLEYLSDGIALISAAMSISMMRDIEHDAPFRRRGKGGFREGEKRRAEMKYKKAESKFTARLQMTQRKGIFYPKLERLVKKLGLSRFERLVVLSLIGNILDPKLRHSRGMMGRGIGQNLHISTIIQRLCDGNLENEIKARASFYRSSRLVASGVVFLHKERMGPGTQDLGELSCSLDRMLFDYIVGLETEMSEIMANAECYSPEVSMETVILPQKLKRLIVERVENFEVFRKLRKELGFDDIVRYGRGLSLFFHGKSGTGKTLFANALASHLGRKVLLIDVNSLSSTNNMTDADTLKVIFREATVQNAIVFMDECDALLKTRGSGGARVGAILQEMENFDGVVILATNRPQSLDEAMHRRIALSLEFPEPDAQMRLDIWKRHIPKDKILADDVSLEALSIEFELTGGFIKNAMFEALASAVTRVMNKRRSEADDKEYKELGAKEVQITMEDLRVACHRQSRADLNRTRLQRRIIPTAGLETLVACDEGKRRLSEVVEVERVRRVLSTRWGFKGQQARSNCVLIMGPHGSGKTHAAACLGFETGRPLQTLSMTEILRKGPSAYEIGKMFSEAAVAGAVVVVEQGEWLMLEASIPHNIASQGLELLYNIKSYNGLVVICVETADSHADAGWAAHTPVPNRIAVLLRYIVQLTKPNRKERLQLWRQLIPKDTPRAPDVDEALVKIANKYDTTGARILACINRAAATAARRGNQSLSVQKMSTDSVLTAQDLFESCEAEVDLVHDTNCTAPWVRALYA